MRHLAGDRAGLNRSDPAARVWEALGGWPAPIEWRPETASTNDDVRIAGRAGCPEWTVVMAGRQTAGRGRQGRPWASETGNLHMSVLLHPPGDATWLGLVPLAAGLAVCDAARASGAAAELKWPNDVLVEGRKLAGILAEAQSSSASVDFVVVGIGVNVGLRREDADESLREAVASLSETAEPPSVEAVAAAVLGRLRGWYDALASPAGRDEVIRGWRARSTPWWGREVQVTSGRETIRGRAVDVDTDGALLLDTSEGRRRVVAGEARELRPRSED